MTAESSRQSSASTGPQHLQSHAAAKARCPPPRQSSSHQDQSGPHHPAHHGNLVPAPADSPDPIGMTTTTNGVAKDRGPVVATSPSDSTSRTTASSSSNARRRPSLLPLPEYYVVNGRESWISPRDMGYLRQLGSSTSPGKTNGHAQQGGKPPLRFKTLPAGYRLGRFVGEGAANAVFEVQLADGTCLRHEDGTRLLIRLAKAPADLPRFDHVKQQWHYDTRIRPILGDYVLHSELAVIRGSGIVDRVNDWLRRQDPHRKKKFRGTYVDHADWAFFLQDMRPEDNALLVEFKPKWLSQSPSAPPSAIRCRQCAKELYSYVSDPDPNKPLPTKAKPCPLTLGRDEYNLVRAESAYRLLPELEQLSRTRSINGTTNGTANGSTKPNGARTRGHHRNNHSLSATLNLLRDEPALKMLRAAQERYDKVGPLQASESDEDFSLAMTLRDCTCLAQIQIAPDGRGRGASDDGGPIPPLKTRFVDFDMKSSKHRLSHWREAERKLIDGGFYTARRILCRGRLYAPPTKCVLELERGDCTPRELIHIVDEGGQPRRPEGEWSRVYDVRTTDEAKLQQCLEMGPATPVSS